MKNLPNGVSERRSGGACKNKALRKIEILAPAGSFESMVGALGGGADAVYMGGRQFGARAYADNPDDDRLKEAIDYVHIHGKKLYLTVNTLLKDRELTEGLYDYLKPLYEQGLDAVIVQDMGVLNLIRQWFPDLDIHASTQMTAVSGEHAGYLKTLGVSRIVPARELSFEEIRRLKDSFGGEIECFVHGALCYCYSGQCLLSSMLGGRSGNRGRCAQPCRLPYALSENGRSREVGGSYLLSPKDICTLDILPQLVECGIDSFKIEGRMKRPEYAAFVSHIYRKYTDMYLKYGNDGYHVDEGDRQALMDLYNRGGFSRGYYEMHNGREMMSLSRPNHFGTCVGRVVKNAGSKKKASDGTITIQAQTALNKGDVLLIDGFSDKESVTLKESCDSGCLLDIRFPKKVPVSAKIYRMRNEHLLEWIQKSFLNSENQEKIYISLTLFKDLPATMHLNWGEFQAEAMGPCVSAALKQPLVEDMVREKMLRTGNTPYVVERLDISMDPDAYLPMQALNQLRRDGIAALEAAVLGHFKREVIGEKIPGIKGRETLQAAEKMVGGTAFPTSVLVSQLSMLDVVRDFEQVSLMYLEPWLLGEKGLYKAVEDMRRSGRKVYLAMPHIFRDDSRRRWDKNWTELLKSGIFDGYLIRNMESLAFLEAHELIHPGNNVVGDYQLYTMNRQADIYYKGLGLARTTVPLELNYKELRAAGCLNREMIVYGYLPLMVSAQCLYKTSGKCQKDAAAFGSLQLKDRYGKVMSVRNVCADCYNLIYNSQPLVLYDMEKELKSLAPSSVRYQFTNETPKQIRSVLSGQERRLEEQFTRGHFNRGVE